MHPIYMHDENGEVIEITIKTPKTKKNKDNFIVKKKKIQKIKIDFELRWNRRDKGGIDNE
ncbi:hypothetical protein ACSVC9_12095 [Clostridium sp. LBM24168]